jgi:hypothetical protein
VLELSLNLLVDIGGWPALKEGRVLLERGKVSEVHREGATIHARVQGAEKVYEAQITLAERVAQIEVRCTCIESRRSGRVCAHIMAAGLAFLQPAQPRPSPAARPAPAAASTITPASRSPSPPRWLEEEAPPGAPLLEITILLPLQLKESLAKDPVRIILEASRAGENQARPFDAILRELEAGFAVREEDQRVLSALEAVAQTASGINAVPREKIDLLLRALAEHPRVWLGKKQRLEVHAGAECPGILLKTLPGGALELIAEVGGPSPASGAAHSLPIPGWSFDGAQITETPVLPAGFSSGTRIISPEKIPEFLSRELPALERTCNLVFAPGFEEFRLETDRPVIEARLEGALSGLTLELIARYGEKEIPLAGHIAPKVEPHWFPDPRQPNRFWRRDTAIEKETLAAVEAAGFNPVRGGAAMFSLISENRVARFLANTLPQWRRAWTVGFGPRLEETMRQIDVAQPEFSLHSASGEDWLGLDLKLSVAGRPVPLDPAEIQRWLQTGQTHARMADGRVLLVPTDSWSEMREVLADCAVAQQPDAGRIRVARTFVPFLAGALIDHGFRAGGTGIAEPPAPEVKAKLDPHLWAQLRPYQVNGVEWLAGLADRKLHGLLADDMGLGKTLQALAFCAWLKAGGGSHLPPALVVCPTSLVTNWLREAARFTPHLRALDLTGSDRASKLASARDHDLLVTSYAILRRDIEAYREKEFSLVILDEAQHIKNRGSQNAQAAKALNARHRLVLTGTPLENSILDLWSLYDFLLPGYLGTAADFRERYETPLSRQAAPREMDRLRQRVRPFFLRRTREQVLDDLPPKLEHPALCELTDEQREVYRAVLEQGRRTVFEHSGKAGRSRGLDRIAVLTTLLRLRQVCCHLDLLPHDGEKRAWREPSAKLDRAFELIDEAVDGGHRVLLFSQFVRVLHLLRDEARRRDLSFCYLDGQTVQRQAEVDRFQAGSIPLFFISLKAGGTGLNLTGADTVIHFDPWWNPAVEEQATARAHRLGQVRPVQSYKLIAAGTVEEKIQALQARKRELFQASLGDDEAFADKLSGDDLEELLAGP